MNETRRTQTHTTGRPKLASIVRKTARVVGYVTLGLGIGVGVNACKSAALDCDAKPLPKECSDAL